MCWQRIPLLAAVLGMAACSAAIHAGSGSVESTRIPATANLDKVRGHFEHLISDNIVLLPYDIRETGAKWRIGFMVDADVLVAPAAAIEEGQFFVATVLLRGSWNSEVVRSSKATDLVTVAKSRGLAPSAESLVFDDPRKHVGEYVYFIGFTGERSVLQEARLVGIHEMKDGNRIVELMTPAKRNNIGGPIFSAEGLLIGVVTDGPIRSNDGLSSFGLSSTDLQRLLKDLISRSPTQGEN